MFKKLTKEMYLLTELPEILNVSYLTCYLYVKNKKLKAFKINGRWHVRREDILRLMDCKTNMEDETM